MKKHLLTSFILLSCLFTLGSCEAIAGIFKAGLWSGIILVVIVVAVIIFIASKFTNRK